MFVARRDATALNVYYTNVVGPSFEAFKSQSAAFDQALKDQKEGKVVHIPEVRVPDEAIIHKWESLIATRDHSDFFREKVKIGILFAFVAWGVLGVFQGIIARKNWESSSRPPNPEAGKIIGDFISSDEILFARTEEGGVDSPEVEVDGRRRIVVFRNLPFVTSFVGNSKCDRKEIPFSELIVGTVHLNKGQSFLQLRTAQGKVAISDRIKPFQRLASLLQDAAELNRTFPDRFKDALSKEPRVRTPWYGWAIIAAAIASAGAAFWWFVVR